RPDPRPGVFRVPGSGDPSDRQRAVEEPEIRRDAPRREVAERSKIGSRSLSWGRTTDRTPAGTDLQGVAARPAAAFLFRRTKDLPS
ncbi:hypothetical protein, partial [Streptomyces vinaceus]|uniref:hypothetical protein n=1 Tax=Streptomyces vinaceus TaxID=1960 RepID=UPI00367C0304